ncbi:MAG: hypothetical protein U0326_31640 [Polyangiales bacterium]
MEDTFLLMGRVVGARYAVERPVARGGFGVVYKARHVELSSPVALKVLAASALDRDDAALVERFRLEARTLAALRHPSHGRVGGGHRGRGAVARVGDRAEASSP